MQYLRLNRNQNAQVNWEKGAKFYLHWHEKKKLCNNGDPSGEGNCNAELRSAAYSKTSCHVPVKQMFRT